MTATATPSRTNGLAIAALVLGIAGLVFLPAALAALWCGYVALRQIRASEDREGGRRFAIAGLVLGAIGTAVLYVVSLVAIAVAIAPAYAIVNVVALGFSGGLIAAAYMTAPPASRRRRVRETTLATFLVVPSLTIFGTFLFYPFLKNFYLALYRNPPFPNLPRKYVGFEQFSDILTSSEFYNSVKVTVLFALYTVPVGIAAGLFLAVLAHQRLRGMAIYRTIFSSSIATSVAVAAVIFGTLMNPRVGLLPWLGIDPNPPILQNPTWALVAVSVTTIWQNLGLSFILMASGLQSIPDDLLEAAEVDGAGPWSRFRNVTFPLLTPTIFFAVVVGTIFAFQSFGQIDLLTEGGPLKRTNVLTYFIFTELRERNDPGSAAVLAIALFAITLVLTIIQMRVLERRVFYGR